MRCHVREKKKTRTFGALFHVGRDMVTHLLCVCGCAWVCVGVSGGVWVSVSEFVCGCVCVCTCRCVWVLHSHSTEALLYFTLTLHGESRGTHMQLDLVAPRWT